MDKAAIIESLESKFHLNREDSNVLVVGLGKTGLSAALYLHQYGFQFAVVDSRSNPPLKSALLSQIPEARVIEGGFHSKDFIDATHLVVSPGVSLNEKVIEDARLRGAKILGDIDLFSCSVREPIVAITGSNGKSTVTTLLGEMAEANGKNAGVGGNLGTPALDLLKQDAELYILELSSFQLERTTALDATAATVLNVSLDHIDRHGSLGRYAAEKSRIFNGNGVMILNADDPVVSAMAIAGRKAWTFGLESKADFQVKVIGNAEWMVEEDVGLMPVKELAMEGRHNIGNALAALALGKSIGLSYESMFQALKAFNGLEHRMQKIAEIDGVVWINDSKATNIGACLAALQGIENKVILIAGGDAKGADMHDLAPVVKIKARAVVLMGKDADRIDRALKDCVPVYKVKTLPEAVLTAAGLANPGDCVLLSPACASIDQFKNYQERGHAFATAVRGLAA